MAPPLRPLAEKLWEKVHIRSLFECWEVRPASRGSRGYGNINHGSRQLGTHRAAWIVTYGAIPDGMVVRHKCDNPPCCNPAHLLLGTQAENCADRKARRPGGYGGGSKKRKRCKRGHDDWYTESDGRRRCRICRNMRARGEVMQDFPEVPFQ